MADLITLAEYKAASGIAGTNVLDDDKFTWLIKVASRLVNSYSGRDFASPQVTEERPFEYDGSGMLDIDDASVITAVKLVVPNGVDLPLDGSYQWFAQPPRRDDAPVYFYITLPGFIGSSGYSPQMGFTRNLDVWVNDYGRPAVPTILKVTGTWGWPVTPDDVKQAVVWTIQEWDSRDEGEGLTAEAIASYSRSWGLRGQASPSLALPDRARDILANYEKIQV